MTAGSEVATTAVTYSRYLHLKELLSLQQPLTPDTEPDVRDSERLFIIVHQVSETLLSQGLIDLRHVDENRCGGRCAAGRVERAARLVETMEGHLHLLRDTLRREDFLGFRDRLGTASGLQSSQFHELFALTEKLVAGQQDGREGVRPALDHLRDAVEGWLRAHLVLVDHMIGELPGTGETEGARFLDRSMNAFVSSVGATCPVAHDERGPEPVHEEKTFHDNGSVIAAAPSRARSTASVLTGHRPLLGRVVVLGGGFAGLLTAHVLAPHAERVTVLERDHSADEAVPRAGVPQSRHTHVLLTSGIRALDELLPGLLDDLNGAGAPSLAVPAEVGVWQAGQWVSRRNPSHPVLTPSRPLLEHRVRQAVLAGGRIEVAGSVDVVGLLGDAHRVTGVRTRRRGVRNAPVDEIDADLVVDATGRSSQTHRWLAELDARPPEEEVVETGRAYATCEFYADEPLGNDLRGFYIVPDAGQPFGTIVLPAENGRWLVTLSGPKGQEPPTDVAGFVDFVSRLPHDAPYKWLSGATAVGRPVGYRHTGNRRRRYDRTARTQHGLLVVGDALCALNPVYGQGMSVAALNAVALSGVLAKARTAPAAHVLQRAVLRSAGSAWEVATGADSPMPGVTGNAVRTGVVPRLLDWYLERVREHVPGDPVVCGAFSEVLFLLSPPRSLLTSAQVVRRSLLRPPVRTTTTP
ncbi:tryptophan 2,3-dioxygenase family protein [Lentzea sp. NPDC059081]|uniref:tryptophan 2,3-dioxygenase family protein n=1 Tax=Lentzea sp. NPDC059081 TaxID=3346719 RepID=UPI0036D0D60C